LEFVPLLLFDWFDDTVVVVALPAVAVKLVELLAETAFAEPSFELLGYIELLKLDEVC
jgi:hypothetical protein